MSAVSGRAEAVAAVAALAGRHTERTVWVGVDGRGAAGKTSFAADLAAAAPRVTVVHVDDFSGPRMPEWDWTRFRSQLVVPLLAGRAARYQRWDWDADAGAEWHVVEPGRILVAEGVSSTRDEVGVDWDLRIWVDAPRDERLRRALERDGAAAMPRWLEDWMPSEERYVAAQHPERRADLTISGVEQLA